MSGAWSARLHRCVTTLYVGEDAEEVEDEEQQVEKKEEKGTDEG